MANKRSVKQDVDIGYSQFNAVSKVTRAFARAVSTNVDVAPRIFHGFMFCLL